MTDPSTCACCGEKFEASRRPAETDGLAERVRELADEWESAIAEIWPSTEQGFGADAAAKSCLADLRALLDVAAPAPEGER